MGQTSERVAGHRDHLRYQTYLEDPRYPPRVKEWLQMRMNEVAPPCRSGELLVLRRLAWPGRVVPLMPAASGVVATLVSVARVLPSRSQLIVAW